MNIRQNEWLLEKLVPINTRLNKLKVQVECEDSQVSLETSAAEITKLEKSQQDLLSRFYDSTKPRSRPSKKKKNISLDHV